MPGQNPDDRELELMREHEASLEEALADLFPPGTRFIVGSPMEAYGVTATRPDDQALDPRYDWPTPAEREEPERPADPG